MSNWLIHQECNSLAKDVHLLGNSNKPHLVISILNHSQVRNVHPAAWKRQFFMGPLVSEYSFWGKTKKQSADSCWDYFYSMLITVHGRVHIAVVQDCLLLYTSLFWRIHRDFASFIRTRENIKWEEEYEGLVSGKKLMGFLTWDMGPPQPTSVLSRGCTFTFAVSKPDICLFQLLQCDKLLLLFHIIVNWIFLGYVMFVGQNCLF